MRSDFLLYVGCSLFKRPSTEGHILVTFEDHDRILFIISAYLPLHAVSLCVIQQIRRKVLVSYTVGSGSELLIHMDPWRGGVAVGVL